MNPLNLELAWQSVLQANIEAATVYCATREQYIDQQTPRCLIVGVEALEHVAGQYWRAQMLVLVDEPVLSDDPRTAQSTMFDELLAVLGNAVTVAEGFPANGVASNGYFVQTSANTIVDRRWVGEIKFVFGCSVSE